jgi:hypothetical protein
VASLTEIHPVCDLHELSQTGRLQMVTLFDHPAHERKACTALRLVPSQGEAFKVRQDAPSEIPNRSHLELESAIAPGLANPTTTKECLQILRDPAVPLLHGRLVCQ